MKKRALLINPPNNDILVSRDMAGGLGFDREENLLLPPLDLAYLAAELIEKDYETKIFDAPALSWDIEKINKSIDEFSPQIIISLVSLPSLKEDCLFFKEIRSDAKKIAKTQIPDPNVLKEILNRSNVDLLIYGECETIIDKILSSQEKRSTAYFDDDGNFKIEEKFIVNDLNTLPLPARQLLPNKNYRYPLLSKNEATTIIQTSRGCPFPCSYYCPYPLVQGKSWRAENPERVICEIEDVALNHKIKHIFFRDATFTLDKKRTLEICRLITKKQIKINWWCETRINALDKELLEEMKKAGCRGINIGIETGDFAVMRSQAKIGVDFEKINEIVNICREIDIKLHLLFMVGLPQETKKSLYKTFQLVKKIRPFSIGVTIVTPYPGTPLFTEAKNKGWINKDIEWKDLGGHSSIMETNALSSRDLIKARDIIIKCFRFSKQPRINKKIELLILTVYFKFWSLV